ncbi:MAG: glycosyltransferase family 25 protein [Chitinophagaceae bacterium]|nr:glycosyltransferase family 25 protein [Chitinophagaceae bacterium]
MKVYVINLKDAVERRNSIAKQLKDLDISYELLEAINGRTLSPDELAEKVDMDEVRKHPGWLTKGALGCALSHSGV